MRMIPREQGETMTGRTFDFETELDEMHRAVLSVLPEKLLDLTDISATREGIEELFLKCQHLNSQRIYL